MWIPHGSLSMHSGRLYIFDISTTINSKKNLFSTASWIKVLLHHFAFIFFFFFFFWYRVNEFDCNEYPLAKEASKLLLQFADDTLHYKNHTNTTTAGSNYIRICHNRLSSQLQFSIFKFFSQARLVDIKLLFTIEYWQIEEKETHKMRFSWGFQLFYFVSVFSKRKNCKDRIHLQLREKKCSQAVARKYTFMLWQHSLWLS